MEVKQKEPTITKRLERIFNRYNVQLRTTDTLVTHPVYGATTVCSPVVFAIYEAALKANFINWEAAACRNNDYQPGYEPSRWQQTIAAEDGIELVPLVVDGTEETVAKQGNQSHDDYGVCCRALGAFYHDLLD